MIFPKLKKVTKSDVLLKASGATLGLGESKAPSQQARNKKRDRGRDSRPRP